MVTNMIGELTSEITRYMDKQVDPKHRLKGFEVYIYTKKNEEGKLVPLEQEDFLETLEFTLDDINLSITYWVWGI